MRCIRPILILALAAVSAGAFSQQAPKQTALATHAVSTPAPTATLLASAEAKAKADGKNVLVIFHASWCIWCKRLDAFMNDPKFKQVFNDNFVVVKLTVLEDDAHKKDENPGGADEMDQLGFKDAGLPVFAILDPTGNVVINSLRPVDGKAPANTGLPGSPEEVAYFTTMMQKGATHATADQIKAMSDYLADQEAAREAAAAKKKAGG